MVGPRSGVPMLVGSKPSAPWCWHHVTAFGGVDMWADACAMLCRYPRLRLAINAAPMQLHLSPFRYQRLMTVLHSISKQKAQPAEQLAQQVGQAVHHVACVQVWRLDPASLQRVKLQQHEPLCYRCMVVHCDLRR